MTRFTKYLITTATALTACFVPVASANPAETCGSYTMPIPVMAEIRTISANIDTANFAEIRKSMSAPGRLSLYELPYSLTTSQPDWKRLWINAGIFAGAYAGTLAVLECLPEGATNWNRTEIENTPWHRRWHKNVLVKGPEWDGDDVIFNYILHPYAGAVYFMAARSCGFNFYQSLLFSACVSTIGWEFGIEGSMERPSIQDIFITPLVGSVIGELFYKAKRHIASNGYTLLGSHIIGNIAAFLIDPVNEIVGLFGGNPARQLPHGITSTLAPRIGNGSVGFSFACTF